MKAMPLATSIANCRAAAVSTTSLEIGIISPYFNLNVFYYFSSGWLLLLLLLLLYFHFYFYFYIFIFFSISTSNSTSDCTSTYNPTFTSYSTFTFTSTSTSSSMLSSRPPPLTQCHDAARCVDCPPACTARSPPGSAESCSSPGPAAHSGGKRFAVSGTPR